MKVGEAGVRMQEGGCWWGMVAGDRKGVGRARKISESHVRGKAKKTEETKQRE